MVQVGDQHTQFAVVCCETHCLDGGVCCFDAGCYYLLHRCQCLLVLLLLMYLPGIDACFRAVTVLSAASPLQSYDTNSTPCTMPSHN